MYYNKVMDIILHCYYFSTDIFNKRLASTYSVENINMFKWEFNLYFMKDSLLILSLIQLNIFNNIFNTLALEMCTMLVFNVSDIQG